MSSRSLRVHAAVALVALIVLAGCVGPAGNVPATEPASSGGDAATDIANPTATAAGPSTPTPTVTGKRANPWGAEPVVVAVADPAATGRQWAPLVRAATAFWEANAERFAGYPIDYEVRPDAADPDIVIEFVERVPECDGAGDAAGCAPLITDDRQIDRPETVSVRTGFSDDSTVTVIEHELGHTLGLTHDDAPAAVMASQLVLTTEPLPNATERGFAWDDPEFTVYVDADNASEPREFREQVRQALDYYEAGAPGLPTNLTFTLVDDPDDAEIVVRPVETSPCGSGAASCGATAGWDPDGDGAIETYSELRISLVDLDSDAVGWHVGYWLAFGFGAEPDAEKPPPFRDASYEERRSAWWE